MKILLAENTEISKAPSRINLLTSKEIKDNSACILNIYSIPVQNRYVKYNEHAECFISITEVTIDVNHDVEKQLR